MNDQMEFKGGRCSKEGGRYEKIIYNTVKNLTYNNKKFNTQKEEELGGSSIRNDLVCNFKDEKDLGIEIKKYNTPDWMQCSIRYDKGRWRASRRGKIPKTCQELFEKLINDTNLYDGEVPPFMEKNITHEEWIEIKNLSDKWNDVYFDIPENTIKELYRMKGCYYIQISNGYGLYHLGEDICGFDVPQFIIPQQMRIRTKIHRRQNKSGFCNLSVTAACQPKNIASLIKSSYSLDDPIKLPASLFRIPTVEEILFSINSIEKDIIKNNSKYTKDERKTLLRATKLFYLKLRIHL